MDTQPAVTAPDPQRGVWQAQLKRGANWFFWIAGLSALNSAIAYAGSDRSFCVGLGVTGILDYLAGQHGTTMKVVALVLNAFALAIFVGAGILARKGHGWAFLAGMTLYGLDAGVLCLGLPTSLLSVAFHGLALFSIFRGFQANRALQTDPVVG